MLLSDISDSNNIISDITDLSIGFAKFLSDISGYFLCYIMCTLCYIARYLAGGCLD